MPKFGLVLLLSHIKLLKVAYLLLKLDDESNLSADAEVAHAQEANRLKERKSVQFLLVPAKRRQILQLYRCDLHDIANVEGQDPFRLIEKAKNMAHIRPCGLFTGAPVVASLLLPSLSSPNLPVHFME